MRIIRNQIMIIFLTTKIDKISVGKYREISRKNVKNFFIFQLRTYYCSKYITRVSDKQKNFFLNYKKQSWET